MTKPPTPLVDRFWPKVASSDPRECWPWTGATDSKGYGRIWAGIELGGPATWNASRVAFVLTFGAIPHGYELDHVCHTRDSMCVVGPACPHRRCVNPSHLEPVTHAENAVRRESRTGACRNGHPRTPENIGLRPDRCLVCHRDAERRQRAKNHDKPKEDDD